MPELTIDHVSKYYGATRAINNVSLNVPVGEFVVLVGPSGCGKSTLLRSIAGLEDVSDGDIRLGDRSITPLPPKDRNIAMVFQSYALYPYLTVFENIAFGMRARKMPEDVIQQKVQWAASLLHLEDYLDRYPRALSGGQRQRVAIGRAIVREADLYLFDEPLSNLDAKLRDGMREEIKLLHKTVGRTFVYVTHDQIEAMTLADRVVLMRDGVIEQEGPPLELFNNPANTFVAQFLGSPAINLIPVKLGNSGTRLILADGQQIDCPNFAGLPDGDYHWGVRPEHVTTQGNANSLKGMIDVIQPTGPRSYVTLRLGNERLVAEVPTGTATEGVDAFRFGVSMERTLLFDPISGARHIQ